MAVKCGVDIIYIPDMQKLFKNEATLQKFFDPTELTTDDMQHLAGIIAAKEAFFKALGQVPHFRDVQIAYEKSNKPQLVVSPQLKKYQNADVSISHDKDYAVAFVVLET